MTTSKLPQFTYNSTSITKNNRKTDIDIDLICEDLYRSVPDKEKFKQIMDSLQDEIFSEDRNSRSTIATSQTYLQHPQMGSSYANQAYNQPMSMAMTSFPSSTNPNVLRFKSTIPDGEMITPGPYQERTQHKKYNDVNANSNYYYPKQDNCIHDSTRSQWTNRANRIIYDSQSNWSNYNDKKVQSPLSASHQSMYSNNMITYNNNNNNNTVMMGSIMSKPNY